MPDLLTITDVARRSGVTSSALRFYEDRGLIASHRTGSGHRRYPRAVLRRIAFIVFAQRVGLSLDEIALELAKLPQNRAPTGRDWQRLSGLWTSRIDARIAELERLRAGLTQCIGCGCLSLERCQLANPGDRAARLSPQLRIHEPSECLACLGVPRAPCAEEFSDLVGRCIGARCWIGVNMNRLCRR